jgi:hypothetical protein
LDAEKRGDILQAHPNFSTASANFHRQRCVRFTSGVEGIAAVARADNRNQSPLVKVSCIEPVSVRVSRIDAKVSPVGLIAHQSADVIWITVGDLPGNSQVLVFLLT